MTTIQSEILGAVIGLTLGVLLLLALDAPWRDR